MGMGLVTREIFEEELANCNGSKTVTRAPESETIPSDCIVDESGAVTPEVITELEGMVQEKQSRGRSNGDNNVPNSLRKLIGETSQIEGRAEALALAKMFDISPSSVSAYAKGATSTKSYDNPKQDIVNFITARKNRITKKALKKIACALDNIGESDLENLGPKDLATVAKDLSGVVKHMEPEQVNQNQSNGPQFIVYAPKMLQENHFETIQVTE